MHQVYELQKLPKGPKLRQAKIDEKNEKFPLEWEVVLYYRHNLLDDVKDGSVRESEQSSSNPIRNILAAACDFYDDVKIDEQLPPAKICPRAVGQPDFTIQGNVQNLFGIVRINLGVVEMKRFCDFVENKACSQMIAEMEAIYFDNKGNLAGKGPTVFGSATESHRIGILIMRNDSLLHYYELPNLTSWTRIEKDCNVLFGDFAYCARLDGAGLIENFRKLV